MLKKGNMALEKYIPSGNQNTNVKPLRFPTKFPEKAEAADPEVIPDMEADVDVDLREVYFLIMHFLSAGPCQRTCGQFWNELLEHDLLPRRYHAWYSRSGAPSSDENDNGLSFPLSYNKVAERYPHIEKDHLVKLLKQLLLSKVHLLQGMAGRNVPNASDVPTLLGRGSFSLLGCNGNRRNSDISPPPIHMRWPHMHADQVRALRLRELGGGFSRHHRSPSTRAACYTIAKPSTMVQKMQNIKKMRGHRNSVYCAIFDRSGRFVITGSDDRLVKVWSMETAYCLASCRGHEGDITDLAVSSNNALVASSSNDCIIRVWRLPDGQPISVLRGHTGVVTAIAFSPRPTAVYQLLSSSDDGTCRLWDARYSQFKPRIYIPKPPESTAGKNNVPSTSSAQQNHQIFCCAFNASGTVFVTGSSDNLARVWNACKSGSDDSDQPIHEMDVLSGHENDVNYVQFSGCAVASRFCAADPTKEENLPKFRNSWFAHDNIVTCSRDGSAIIWIPRSRKLHGKAGRWTRAYHLKVPPPPMPPQPPHGGPRQRALPTPRGVNMIVWSLDNRFVLAAIMDCRICVWNASDGSLVHSLTGHTESTYVLDVHPINPRIAMSAGYDGKTIIWDIWEGKPIRTYKTGHFRLVDGKFSPDGTSIILSDDVGQLYILSTGQGESQKDAKYDQFFLGDYRPLIRDTHGNVVDQETQLPPYRRNMQDLLCDSSMIPYPEPYQSMYQRRRLGTLGIEWRPSAVRFAVGPDFNSEQDQILPLPDWNVLIDPLPEFADAMDWEPEIEVRSDDTDSEFNITDSFGGEEGHISSTSSGDLEGSDEDSDAECSHRDAIRKSRRRKKKREIEITTSSGRRVKRRNLDECDGSSHRVHQNRKLKNGQKPLRKKSSKASRPRRAAARNALTLFSKIKGVRSSDGEAYESECYSSESESILEDSNFESEESDKVDPDEVRRHLKGKGVVLDDSEDVDTLKDLHESYENAWSRKRLVLKFPVGDSSRGLSLGKATTKYDSVADLVGPSSIPSDVPVEADERDTNFMACDRRVGWFGGYNNEAMRWGGVRARTSKRPRLSDANASGSNALGNRHNETEHNARADLITVIEDGFGNTDGKDELNGIIRSENPNEVQDEDHMGSNQEAPCSMNGDDLINPTPVATQNNVSMRLRISSKKITSDPNSANEVKKTPVIEIEKNDECNTDHGSISALEQKVGAEEPEQENSELKTALNYRDSNGVPKSDGLNGNASDQQRNDRMYSAVYRRSRSSKAARKSLENGGPQMDESTSNGSSKNMNGNVNGGAMELKDKVEEHALNSSSRLMERSRRAGSFSLNRGDQLPREDCGSGITVGLRSTRNRRVNFVRDASPVEKRKSCQSQRKLSWLILSTPDSTRYIPQLGDEVAYLRQGHQECISDSRSSMRGPWDHLKGEIKAVEFCKVVELEYSTVPGSGDSCCKLMLEFVDPSSSVFGKTFKLTLPEVNSFPDFLVERTRYEAAIHRNWTMRDKCQVWWKNEGEEDGSWWEGRILSIKAKSPEFPDSPWERFAIRYKSDPAETHCHSPWELHDAETQWEQPHLDDATRKKLLASLLKLAQTGNRAQDIYGVQKLRQVSEKSSFLNRFPVPLSFDLIQSRLENNYYRSLEAVEHDIKVMLSNAESYFGKNAELLKKIGRLSEWLTRMFSSL